MLSSLLSIGPFQLYTFSVSLVLAWCVFSFLFWRALRRLGVEEDRIFDFTFYATLAAIICARVGFVVSYWSIFVGKSPLLIVAIWVAPGLSWLLGLSGGLATMLYVAKRNKIRLGVVLDSIALSLPISIIFAKIGSFLGGSQMGTTASVPWAIRYLGDPKLRHPVQVYEVLTLVIITAITLYLSTISDKRKWPIGILGASFFFLYSITTFILEFFVESHVYFGRISANQWIVIGFFAESLGVLYIRGGWKHIGKRIIVQSWHKLHKIGVHIYEAVSKRHTSIDKKSS
jgi:phosphatidylglycerol---prolipoprotein diacylglyceryl transferase